MFGDIGETTNEGIEYFSTNFKFVFHTVFVSETKVCSTFIY